MPIIIYRKSFCHFKSYEHNNYNNNNSNNNNNNNNDDNNNNATTRINLTMLRLSDFVMGRKIFIICIGGSVSRV